MSRPAQAPDYNNLTFDDLVNNFSNIEKSKKNIFVKNIDGSYLLLGNLSTIKRHSIESRPSDYLISFKNTDNSNELTVSLMYPDATGYKIVLKDGKGLNKTPTYKLLNTTTTIVIVNGNAKYQNKFIAKDDVALPAPDALAQTPAQTPAPAPGFASFLGFAGGKCKSNRHKKSKSHRRRRNRTHKRR